MKVIITGATSGIGAGIAQKFAQEGHDLWLTGRRTEKLNEIQTLLTTKYAVSVYIDSLDVKIKEDVQQWAQKVKDKWGAPDVLINNAGLAQGLAPIDKGDTDDWDRMIDTNVKGLLYVSRAIVPMMVSQQKGHVFNIASTAGKVVYANGNVYCATKFAVDALSQSMRIDLLNHNIKVTSINPGMVDTEFSIVRFKGDAAKADTTYSGLEPLHARDVANTIYYCASLPEHVCINDLTITCTRQANSIYKVLDKDIC